MTTLKELVFEAMQNAHDNGYDELLTDTAEHIAQDMMAYDADISEYPEISESLIVPFIDDWRSQHV